MIPRVEPEGMLFRKPVSTPDQVRGRLFRDHALADRAHATRELARFSTGFAMRQPEGWHARITSKPRHLWRLSVPEYVTATKSAFRGATMSERRVALITGAAGGIGRAMTA